MSTLAFAWFDIVENRLKKGGKKKKIESKIGSSEIRKKGDRTIEKGVSKREIK